MAQKPKKPADMTTDEAMKHLFHPKVVEHAKRHAREAEAPKRPPSENKSTNED